MSLLQHLTFITFTIKAIDDTTYFMLFDLCRLHKDTGKYHVISLGLEMEMANNRVSV